MKLLYAVVLLLALVEAKKTKKDEKKPNEPVPAAEKKDVGTVIGIDLGTTYSCVGVWKDDHVEIIPNELGSRITPSWVAFKGQERLIGEAAKNQVTLNPLNTVYEIKRFMGRRWEDKTVQKDREMLPFKLVPQDGKPYVEVTLDGKKKKYSPEEISAMILRKMKEVAETYLGKEVTSAVVTVPAYFNDAQRQATKDAGSIAGLNVLRIINEPTAAAIAYGLDRGISDTKILVFDLGGGTFDVSLLTVDKGVFEVLATSGDTHLGGEDFDHRIVEHLLKVVKQKFNVDLSDRKRALAKLKQEAEKAKRVLSTQHSTKVEIESLIDGQDFEETLTRAKFEQLNDDLFQKTMDPVKQVLKDAAITKKDVAEVILVGGSTRIPRVQQLLTEFFNGKELNKAVNPDEAVAFGAAVQGSVLSGEGGVKTKELLLLDVLPLTIGLELTGGVMMRFIERNSVIPAKVKKMVTTEHDFQTQVPIRVYQGERPKTKDNMLLGQFDLTGLPPAKRGVPQIEVTFNVDANGILQVTAEDKATKKTGSVTITADKGRLTQDEIARMVREAQQFSEQDKHWQEAQTGKQELSNYIYGLSETLKSSAGDKLDDDERQAIEEAISETNEWIDNLNGEKRLKEDYDAKKAEVESAVGAAIEKIYGRKARHPEERDEDDDDHHGHSHGHGEDEWREEL